MTQLRKFLGNCPGNVARDAKYVVGEGAKARTSVVKLTYRVNDEERWHVTTEDHPELVQMVSSVKSGAGDSPHGPFYINEYRQVLVPVGPKSVYYLAGEYAGSLRFSFEGKTLSGDAVDLDGKPIKPGDTWVGPHPGIPYVLKAGGKDISYEVELRPNVTKTVLLSKCVGKPAAAAFAARIQQVKGFQGGRFYVNEWCQVFAPVSKASLLQYVYIGRLHDGSTVAPTWFPKPESEPAV